MDPRVDAFLGRAKQWPEEMKKLRTIILDCGLTEEVKWGKPCYSFQGTNIVIIQGFSAYCALLFFKGVLLSDPDGILKKTGENTVVGRQARFNSVREIVELEPVLKSYIYEAIEIEKAGLKVEIKREPEPIPVELQKKMKELPDLKKAFNALTPGRQRSYILYFSSAKQSKTREARIEKCMPKIFEGKDINGQ
jgi:uncharacterized protein YdeI (YjbR/CyaY-like superfamily)